MTFFYVVFMYSVKLEKFEGPMDLLLELIEKEKMKITELSLATVADQYLEYIKKTDIIQLENLAEFLLVASKLILIKSRALLPMLTFTEEEEEEIKDLETQLIEYKKFKEASMKIKRVYLLGRVEFSRESFSGSGPIFYPPSDLNAFDLRNYFQKVLGEIPIFEKLEEELVKEVVTLEQRISELADNLKNRMQSSFSELVAQASDKIDVIVSFLAMLEMIKQRIVEVEQKDLFSEIKISMKQE